MPLLSSEAAGGGDQQLVEVFCRFMHSKDCGSAPQASFEESARAVHGGVPSRAALDHEEVYLLHHQVTNALAFLGVFLDPAALTAADQRIIMKLWPELSPRQDGRCRLADFLKVVRQLLALGKTLSVQHARGQPLSRRGSVATTTAATSVAGSSVAGSSSSSAAAAAASQQHQHQPPPRHFHSSDAAAAAAAAPLLSPKRTRKNSAPQQQQQQAQPSPSPPPQPPRSESEEAYASELRVLKQELSALQESKRAGRVADEQRAARAASAARSAAALEAERRDRAAAEAELQQRRAEAAAAEQALQRERAAAEAALRQARADADADAQRLAARLEDEARQRAEAAERRLREKSLENRELRGRLAASAVQEREELDRVNARLRMVEETLVREQEQQQQHALQQQALQLQHEQQQLQLQQQRQESPRVSAGTPASSVSALRSPPRDAASGPAAAAAAPANHATSASPLSSCRPPSPLQQEASEQSRIHELEGMLRSKDAEIDSLNRLVSQVAVAAPAPAHAHAPPDEAAASAPLPLLLPPSTASVHGGGRATPRTVTPAAPALSPERRHAGGSGRSLSGAGAPPPSMASCGGGGGGPASSSSASSSVRLHSSGRRYSANLWNARSDAPVWGGEPEAVQARPEVPPPPHASLPMPLPLPSRLPQGAEPAVAAVVGPGLSGLSDVPGGVGRFAPHDPYAAVLPPTPGGGYRSSSPDEVSRLGSYVIFFRHSCSCRTNPLFCCCSPLFFFFSHFFCDLFCCCYSHPSRFCRVEVSVPLPGGGSWPVRFNPAMLMARGVALDNGGGALPPPSQIAAPPPSVAAGYAAMPAAPAGPPAPIMVHPRELSPDRGDGAGFGAIARAYQQQQPRQVCSGLSVSALLQRQQRQALPTMQPLTVPRLPPSQPRQEPPSHWVSGNGHMTARGFPMMP